MQLLTISSLVTISNDILFMVGLDGGIVPDDEDGDRRFYFPARNTTNVRLISNIAERQLPCDV